MSTRDRTNFRSTLAEIGPLVATGITEAIRYSTIRAINHTGTSGMQDPRHGFLILQNSGRVSDRDHPDDGKWAYGVDRGREDALRLMSGGITVDLEEKKEW